MKAKTTLCMLGLLVGSALLLPGPARASHEALAVYEDWSTAATMRSDRWFGASDLGHERLRKVAGDKLVIRFRREGGTGSDLGATGFFSHRLSFSSPGVVDAVEAEFRVRDLSATGCPANPTASIARAAAIDLPSSAIFLRRRSGRRETSPATISLASRPHSLARKSLSH